MYIFNLAQYKDIFMANLSQFGYSQSQVHHDKVMAGEIDLTTTKKQLTSQLAGIDKTISDSTIFQRKNKEFLGVDAELYNVLLTQNFNRYRESINTISGFATLAFGTGLVFALALFLFSYSSGNPLSLNPFLVVATLTFVLAFYVVIAYYNRQIDSLSEKGFKKFVVGNGKVGYFYVSYPTLLALQKYLKNELKSVEAQISKGY